MSETSQALDDLDARISVDVAHFVELIAEANARADAAAQNDAADAATIADLRAQIDASNADAAATAARIRTIDPDPSFPAPAGDGTV